MVELSYIDNLYCNFLTLVLYQFLTGQGMSDKTSIPATTTTKTKEWYEDCYNPQEDAYNPSLSGKLVLLFEIIKYCESKGEKL